MPTAPIVDFLKRVVTAFGITATVEVEETADGPRFNLAGEEAELLVRHRGEPLKALQQIVDSCYGRSLDGEKRVFVDQQLGPLNPYERRIVHMAVAEVPGATTESVGDAFSKTVMISARK